MKNRKWITEEEYLAFEQAVIANKLTITKAAKLVGRTVNGLKGYALRLNKAWPNQQLNTRQINVGLGKKVSECEEVLAYIESHGGTISDALKVTKSAVSYSTVKSYALKTGFNINDYRNAYKTYGKWLLLPGKSKKVYKNDYLLKALCLGCNTIHTVMATNIRSGQSKCCAKCGHKERRRYLVRCVESREEYRSILAWVTAIGCRKQYLTLKKKLHKKGTLEIDKRTYELVEKPSSSLRRQRV